MCDEAALKCIPDWFVTSGMIKKLFSASYTDEILLYFNKDFGDATFNYNKMGIVNINLNNINLDDDFDKDISIIILFKVFAWHRKFEKRKLLKKKLNEEVIFVVSHPNSWWD